MSNLSGKGEGKDGFVANDNLSNAMLYAATVDILRTVDTTGMKTLNKRALSISIVNCAAMALSYLDRISKE